MSDFFALGSSLGFDLTFTVSLSTVISPIHQPGLKLFAIPPSSTQTIAVLIGSSTWCKNSSAEACQHKSSNSILPKD
jgi:hypothetical protein